MFGYCLVCASDFVCLLVLLLHLLVLDALMLLPVSLIMLFIIFADVVIVVCLHIICCYSTVGLLALRFPIGCVDYWLVYWCSLLLVCLFRPWFVCWFCDYDLWFGFALQASCYDTCLVLLVFSWLITILDLLPLIALL